MRHTQINDYIREGVLILGTTGILGWVFFVVGTWLVHCRMFSGICALHSLSANSTISGVTIKTVPQHGQMSPTGHEKPQLKTTVLESHTVTRGYQIENS